MPCAHTSRTGHTRTMYSTQRDPVCYGIEKHRECLTWAVSYVYRTAGCIVFCTPAIMQNHCSIAHLLTSPTHIWLNVLQGGRHRHAAIFQWHIPRLCCMHFPCPRACLLMASLASLQPSIRPISFLSLVCSQEYCCLGLAFFGNFEVAAASRLAESPFLGKAT